MAAPQGVQFRSRIRSGLARRSPQTPLFVSEGNETFFTELAKASIVLRIVKAIFPMGGTTKKNLKKPLLFSRIFTEKASSAPAFLQ